MIIEYKILFLLVLKIFFVICFSGQREDKSHTVGLGDSSSESGDDMKRQSLSRQPSHAQVPSCSVQQQQQQQQQSQSQPQQHRMIDHQQSSSMYPLSAPVVVSTPQTYHLNHTGVSLNHSHTPTHMQHHDTSSESGDDKRNFHHHLQHHLQATTHIGHSIVSTSGTHPLSPSCAQQKSQLDYMQYYGAQVRINEFINI